MASSATPSRASLPCPAWIWSNNSNCHVAKDRSWFGDDYRPITSHLGTIYHNDLKITVIGIGTVLLPVKTHPNRQGPMSHGTIRLERVLHAPSGFCNVIGNPILDSYQVEMGPNRGSIKELPSKRQVAYFKPDAALFEVRLSGPPVGPVCGPNPFEPGGMYMINCHWPEAEGMKHMTANNAPTNETIPTQGEEPWPGEKELTQVEKEWLKDNFDGEFKFLRAYGLSIYKDEDRAEGRSILRAMMQADDEEGVIQHISPVFKGFPGSQVALDNGSDNDSEGQDVDADGFHQHLSPADYAFTSEQLAWMRESYGSSEMFMLSYGLKFYNEEDVEEAQAIAAVMMSNDDSD